MSSIAPFLICVNVVVSLGTAFAAEPLDLPRLLAELGKKESGSQRLVKSVVASNELKQVVARIPDRRIKVDLRITHEDGRSEATIIGYANDGRALPPGRLSRPNRELILWALASVDNPFDESQQPKYRFTFAGANANDASKIRIVFGPKGPKSQQVFVGEATVDVKTGNLLSLQLQPSELLDGTERLDVKMDFGATSPLGSVVSKMVIEGIWGDMEIEPKFGRVVLWPQRLHLTTNYSHYVFKEVRQSANGA